MPTEVIMPQMGESIFEGTITKWLKKPGDNVQRDEPLFEISTDKVDAEIPSPAAGVLSEIKIPEGTTVQINTVVGVINESGSATASAPTPQPTTPKAEAPAQTPVASTPAAPAVGGAATDVIMPQMGESIFEGTITKWLKQVGDSVQRDESLFEISTDKVDAEIPSPAAGVLSEIKVPAGTTVQINTVVGVIGGAAGTAATPAVPAPAPAKTEAAPASTVEPQEAAASVSENMRSSPLVRKIAKDNNLDLNRVAGSGAGGRITKTDVLGFLEKHGTGTTAPAAVPVSAPAPPTVAAKPAASPAAPTTPALPGELVPLSRMRAIIAQRMIDSKRTNAHVHTVFKIDFTRIVKIREKEKSKYEQRNGVKLTYMPFISRAVIATLRKMPIVNASMEGEAIRYHQNINLGIAVALDWGLIVPVIKQAEERSFVGVARAIADLAERARGKKLKPDEVGSGTFTITNPGIFGEQFGTPIINQPESAILGVGGLFKEPAVITDDSGTDSIAIRHMIHLTLGFDHRIIDGADAGRFMAEVKKYLENWSEDIG
ncbi:2-oxoglutarate dehydrogenase, E2 component, dihydrolipoamide succinyltransferase [Alloacidobacterium dinghuense]|uniref:Dihydrolipoamide acetyltransferase component of pyruvate dehydrogenase complex n=1 Tax=Alloacidobacterium dinghuense TaxID=2763107 RepID=A0A7G8BGD7_9BACT|nr:2-oxoglutarate dehydrogenase, E2 component, dihydrolipoamide succinyltransferase [Alloacidobacterium dinghuense]QNI31607.1 2-oxoglutarate dehydrogenase, E2 component, dihydrolipoamide succinyltransferase [Alloacidobacterium dinghuense]